MQSRLYALGVAHVPLLDDDSDKDTKGTLKCVHGHDHGAAFLRRATCTKSGDIVTVPLCGRCGNFSRVSPVAWVRWMIASTFAAQRPLPSNFALNEMFHGRPLAECKTSMDALVDDSVLLPEGDMQRLVKMIECSRDDCHEIIELCDYAYRALSKSVLDWPDDGPVLKFYRPRNDDANYDRYVRFVYALRNDTFKYLSSWMKSDFDVDDFLSSTINDPPDNLCGCE